MIDILNNRENYFPPELYKYREINNKEALEENIHIDALKNEKVYLSNPYFFNDPYDSLFSIDMQKIKEQIIQTLKEQIVQKEIDKNNIVSAKIENIDLIYKDINIQNQNIISNLIENNSEVLYDTYLKKQIRFKICCFSEIPDSILMWSHYSNYHKGFCIGYDTSKIEERIKKEFYPVFYHEILFPLVKIEDKINTGKFNSLIKYKDWEYEKEWRLILNEEFVPLKPSKIYLGIKFDDNEYLDYFKEFAHEKNCKLYRMEMNYSEYALKAKEINL